MKWTNICIKTTHHIQEKPDMIYSLFLTRNNGCHKAVEIGRVDFQGKSFSVTETVYQIKWDLKNAKSEH